MAAMLVFWGIGGSINMMSLLALSLAIGLLIDDAVVVRETIFAEMEKGKSAKCVVALYPSRQT